MNTIQEIHDACDKVVTAMLDKGFVTPRCVLSVSSGTRLYQVDLWVNMNEGPQLADDGITDYLETFRADTPAEAFAAARARVADQPDPETAALHKYMRDLGKVVDQGRADGIPDEYTEPVSLTVKAMSDNLLTSEAAQ